MNLLLKFVLILVYFLLLGDIDLCRSRSSGFYADNGIDQTIVYQQISKKERREMQQEILSLLGLNHRPKPTPHGTENSAPKYMMNLYNSIIDDENGNYIKIDHMKRDNNFTDESLHTINDADVIMSFVNHGHHLSHIRHDKDRRFWFDVSEVPPEETIMEAQLRLYKESINEGGSEDVSCNITVFELVQGLDPEDKELHYLDSVNVSVDHTGWIKLNVSGAASDWVFYPDKNQGLYLSIQKEGQTRELHPREIGLIGNKGPADRQPFMVAFFKTPQELHHVRRTRAANRRQRMDVSDYNGNDYNIHQYLSEDKNFAKRSCQTRTLFVSFKELGWQNWIIAPDGYSAFYCKGECSFPLNAQMNATNHAIVQTLVNLMKPQIVPKPCCAPTKLSSISVLYFDDNSNVILKKYKNMVVKACGCH